MSSSADCPYCDDPDVNPCAHLLAEWTNSLGGGSSFSRSPFPEGQLPWADVEYDSLAILEPPDAVGVLGDLSVLENAYPHGLFEPPSPEGMFTCLIELMSIPSSTASRRAGGMAGGGSINCCYAENPALARKQIDQCLKSLRKRLTVFEKSQRKKDRQGRGVSRPNHVLLYAVVGETLVFAKRARAKELALRYEALHNARTWGELRRSVKPRAFAELLDCLTDALDFATFLAQERELRPGLQKKDARLAFLDLRIGHRLPEDRDPFEASQVPAIGDGYWPGWPAREMLNWVPRRIQEEYGQREAPHFGDFFLRFNPPDERRILAAFNREGYRCVADETVVLASGY